LQRRKATVQEFYGAPPWGCDSRLNRSLADKIVKANDILLLVFLYLILEEY
jgi:hypothetical protein